MHSASTSYVTQPGHCRESFFKIKSSVSQLPTRAGSYIYIAFINNIKRVKKSFLNVK